MVALRTVAPRRATVTDAAGTQGSARLTWHPEVRRFTLTHWDGRVCIAAVQISPEDAVDLLSVLAEGLADEPLPVWLTPDAT
ncbi:MAG: hypothetical protein ACRDZZ_06315 [Ilumatobacteraceae bacterium]